MAAVLAAPYIEKSNMKKLLVVVDMQNDFVSGSLGTKEAEAVVPLVKAKIESYKERGEEVVFTMDTHHDNYLETPESHSNALESMRMCQIEIL